MQEHFKHWISMVAVLTLIGSVADIYVYLTYIKGGDDVVVSLFLIANVLVVVVVTSVVSTVVEFTAIAGHAIENMSSKRRGH